MENEELKKIITDLTDEDIEQDVEIEMYSTYGGTTLGLFRVSVIGEVIEDLDKEVGKDFHLVKNNGRI